jgi:ABC-2 type transport system ATP-binding protein
LERLGAEGISFSYGTRRVLDGVSFQVGAGEVFGVLGPNGAGKSTLFALLTGLLRPEAGELRLDGAAIRPGARALRARLGVVFQEPSLDLKLTARENLLLGAALFRVPAALARDRAAQLLAVAGLADRAGEPVRKLSGGMRRRLELARALMHRPSILILDEPTTGLDAASFAQAWEALLTLRREEGLTLLVTTHRPDEAERCDRLAVLSAGKVIACEPPETLRARVAGDVLVIEAPEPDGIASEIGQRFGVIAQTLGETVVVVRERGHELIPRLVESFPNGRLRSVAMHRPTLADAFVKLTGQPLEREGARA